MEERIAAVDKALMEGVEGMAGEVDDIQTTLIPVVFTGVQVPNRAILANLICQFNSAITISCMVLSSVFFHYICLLIDNAFVQFYRVQFSKELSSLLICGQWPLSCLAFDFKYRSSFGITTSLFLNPALIFHSHMFSSQTSMITHPKSSGSFPTEQLVNPKSSLRSLYAWFYIFPLLFCA